MVANQDSTGSNPAGSGSVTATNRRSLGKPQRQGHPHEVSTLELARPRGRGALVSGGSRGVGPLDPETLVAGREGCAGKQVRQPCRVMEDTLAHAFFNWRGRRCVSRLGPQDLAHRKARASSPRAIVPGTAPRRSGARRFGRGRRSCGTSRSRLLEVVDQGFERGRVLLRVVPPPALADREQPTHEPFARGRCRRMAQEGTQDDRGRADVGAPNPGQVRVGQLLGVRRSRLPAGSRCEFAAAALPSASPVSPRAMQRIGQIGHRQRSACGPGGRRGAWRGCPAIRPPSMSTLTAKAWTPGTTATARLVRGRRDGERPFDGIPAPSAARPPERGTCGGAASCSTWRTQLVR